jgi:methylmalonyl-CoA epimerase
MLRIERPAPSCNLQPATCNLYPESMPELDHIGIAVKSIAQARKLYESLGLQVVHEETVEQEQVRTAMIPAGEARIELLEPTQDDSPMGRVLA